MRSRIVKGEKVSDKKKLNDFVEKIGGVKFVLSPETAETIESEKTFCIRTRPDLRATATSFRTKIFSRVKSQLIVETRKYYLENIPNATFPNGGFFNPAGGSMVLFGKDKKPIGTLIISYSVKFENPELRELESAEFVTISDIPDTWEKLPRTAKRSGTRFSVKCERNEKKEINVVSATFTPSLFSRLFGGK